ncbi:MAG: hypothetical protein LBM07_03190 [Culturomica sp.]|jgi:GNAT superfamily N-acetyltransferase|nr:hypothetical protein [Culturomica sp.]
MYTIEKVVTPEQGEDFIKMAADLYKDNRYWVRPLDNDIRNVFNPEKNPCFKHGVCERWLLKDKKGSIVGRVAAFINEKDNKVERYKVGQMGFFECINDKEAAFMLFDTCRTWLEDRGMEVMEGPVNFGERIEWWGLLVQGFDKYPNYGMPYTHDYYVPFFEEYGFLDYFQQFTFRTELVEENLSKVVVWKANRILKNPDYEVSTYREIGKRKAIDSLLYIYNKAWNVDVHGVDKLTREQVESLYKSLQPIIDKDLIFFAFHKGEPIGFFLLFPEINHALRHLNGKLDMLGILKFFYYRHVKKINVALGQLFGVIPEFQKRGVEAAMIVRFCEYVFQKKIPYNYLEMNWVGDFNPPMVHLMDYIGGYKDKVHVTYRKMLKEGLVFTRAVDKNHEK